MLSLQQFQQAAALSPALADKWYDGACSAMQRFDITTPARIAAFIAQTAHETMGYVYVREIWGPTPAQTRYEGRLDLGNVQPGDGKRFLGRSWIMVTGRDNYLAVADALAIDCVAHPELLEDPINAPLAGALWWGNHGCNEVADSGDFDKLSDIINKGHPTIAYGDANGFTDRLRRWEIAKKALGA